MNYLVDTNVLSELAKPQASGDVMACFVKHEPHLYNSSITLGEIRKGLELLPTGKRKTSLQTWFKAVCERMDGRVLSFNTSTAHVWGRLVASLEKIGIQIPTLDSQLAATAQRHGLTMVTRNVADLADFKKIIRDRNNQNILALGICLVKSSRGRARRMLKLAKSACYA